MFRNNWSWKQNKTTKSMLDYNNQSLNYSVRIIINTTRMKCFIIYSKSSYLGVWLGVWRWLGSRNILVWRRCSITMWQGVRRDLLQGKEDCTREPNARLGQAARPAWRRSLDTHTNAHTHAHIYTNTFTLIYEQNKNIKSNTFTHISIQIHMKNCH